MDVLVLSCGTGGGHDSAARAIREEMEKRGHNTVMLNPYKLKSGKLASVIDKAYIALARSSPKAFGAVYKLGDLYRKLPFRSPIYFVNRVMNSTMKEYLVENHFDIVIMTHLFAAEIFTNMKNHGINIPKTIFVATDYVCIPFTEETECDAYVVPAIDLQIDFVNRGIPLEKLYPFGVPVHNAFSERITRDEAKSRIGFKENKKYILIAGGSMGGGKIEKAIKKLCCYIKDENNTELIVVCGSNKVLYDKLINMSYAGVTVVGYTDAMASYIKASDLFITKAGGLSSTEAAVCGVPVWHTASIPGCETYNARYFSQHGMSITGEITNDSLSVINMLLNNDDMSRSMINRQKRYVSSQATIRICDLAEKMAEESVS